MPDFKDQLNNRVREGDWYYIEKDMAPSLIGKILKVVPPSLVAVNPNAPKGMIMPGRIEIMVPIIISGDREIVPGIYRVFNQTGMDVVDGDVLQKTKT